MTNSRQSVCDYLASNLRSHLNIIADRTIRDDVEYGITLCASKETPLSLLGDICVGSRCSIELPECIPPARELLVHSHPPAIDKKYRPVDTPTSPWDLRVASSRRSTALCTILPNKKEIECFSNLEFLEDREDRRLNSEWNAEAVQLGEFWWESFDKYVEWVRSKGGSYCKQRLK